jgi:CBS domain-containing protein
MSAKSRKPATPGNIASEIMAKQVVTIPISCTLSGAAMILQENHITGAPVVDNHNKLVGMLSQTDLVRYWMRSRDHVRVLRQPRVEEEELLEESGREANGYAGLDEEDARLLSEDFLEEDFGDARVGDAYTPYVIVAKPSDTIAFIGGLMAARQVHRIIIADQEKPVGIVTSFDVMRALTKGVATRPSAALHAI